MLKGVDHGKTGLVKHDVFFELLKLHRIDLNNQAIQYLKKNFSKNDEIKYKEAMNQLTIDLAVAGAESANMKWTVQGLASRQTLPKIGNDSVS